MEERTIGKNEGIVEVDLWKVVLAIWHRIWFVILSALLGTTAIGIATYFFVTPQYQSSAIFYVNNSSFSVGDASLDITSGDISASKELVESYIVILKTRESLNDVIDYAGVDRTCSQMKNMISAASVNSTEIFEVVVTSPNPEEAEKIADAIAYILPKRISSIIEGTSAKVVDSAVLAASPSSPNYIKNCLLGFMLGIVFSIVWIVLREMFNITIRSEEDVAQACKYPILASVPDMLAPSKGKYYYGASRKKRKKQGLLGKKEETNFVGDNISFAAAEAYKLLRTKVQFSFADESDCHIIGVSSALAGEGKSLSSVNLAYSLSQLNKRVLLVDCDMRRPSVSDKLNVSSAPGLSNYLTRQIQIKDILQNYKDGDASFHVIAAGANPPNPIELLSSTRMEKLIEAFREYYDYIILDLPPVDEVSDAMVASKIADGILLVVRQDYCDRLVLNTSVRQFEFVDARIIGLVMNCTTEVGTGYGKRYGKYRKYYRRYRYGYSYASTSVADKETSKEQRENKA